MSSRIQQDWQAGKGLPDLLVIDGHVHIGEWPHNTTFRNAEEAAELSVALMDAHGVDAACALSGGYMWPPCDYRLGNDFLLDVCARTRGRLIGFTCVNPNDKHAAVLAELDRMFAVGIRCIKLLNDYQEGYPGDGPNLMAVYEYAAEHGMLVFNHAWRVDVIKRIAARFPDIDFVLGHYNGALDPVLATCPNVYTSIWDLGSYGWLERGIRNVGAEKFLMGSDGFLNPMSVGIGPVVFARIPDDDKALVLGLNQARLLDKVGVLPVVLKASYEQRCSGSKA